MPSKGRGFYRGVVSVSPEPSRPPSQRFSESDLTDSIVGLYRYALTLTASDADAEDLVSATLVRAMEKQASFQGVSSVATWLHRIMHNLAVDHARRAREYPQDPEVLALAAEQRWRRDDYCVDAEVVALRSLDIDQLREALLRVPVTYRSALVMHDMLGLTGREVSETLEIGLPAAKQRIRRGRMMLVSSLAAGAEREAALEGVPLDCWSARSRIDDYLDHETDSATNSALESHLASCPTCPPLLRSIVTTQAAVSDLRDDDSVLPEALAERLRSFADHVS